MTDMLLYVFFGPGNSINIAAAIRAFDKHEYLKHPVYQSNKPQKIWIFFHYYRFKSYYCSFPVSFSDIINKVKNLHVIYAIYQPVYSHLVNNLILLADDKCIK